MENDSEEIRLRKANRMDLMQIYAWRNQQEIVDLSRTGQKVSLKDHEEWFMNAIKSDQVLMLIIENKQKAIGQIRFDHAKEEVCEMSIYLEKTEVGKGRGEYLIKAGCRELFKMGKIARKVLALIKIGNERSIRAFKKAGFKEVPQTPENGQSEMVSLVYKLEVD